MSTMVRRGQRSHHNGTSQLIRRFDRAVVFLLDYVEVAKQRRQLLALEDHALKDIGVTRAEANLEGNRSFWDLPDHHVSSRSTHGRSSNLFGGFTGEQGGLGQQGSTV